MACIFMEGFDNLSTADFSNLYICPNPEFTTPGYGGNGRSLYLDSWPNQGHIGIDIPAGTIYFIGFHYFSSPGNPGYTFFLQNAGGTINLVQLSGQYNGPGSVYTVYYNGVEHATTCLVTGSWQSVVMKIVIDTNYGEVTLNVDGVQGYHATGLNLGTQPMWNKGIQTGVGGPKGVSKSPEQRAKISETLKAKGIEPLTCRLRGEERAKYS